MCSHILHGAALHKFNLFPLATKFNVIQQTLENTWTWYHYSSKIHRFVNYLCMNLWQISRKYSLNPKSNTFISLSFCSFLYNGVCFDGLKLSVNDVIYSQKVPIETESCNSLGRTIILLALFAQNTSLGKDTFWLYPVTQSVTHYKYFDSSQSVAV